jgi:superfamily II DNA or RNA helicase
MAELTPGIYDHLIDQELEELIHQIDREKNIVQIGTLDQAVLPDYLTRTLSEHIHKSLRIVPEEKRYDLANRLLRILSEIDGQLDFLKRHQIESSECNLLTEIHSVEQKPKQRPSTPLVFPSLFTGASGSPQLGRELELELESADRMDMLVSFIKTAGTNLLFSALKKFTDRGGELRIITTTYLGASDPVAIRKLNSLRNTRIKVNYDTRHSRLHAKAYFIHRNSGLSCAYIGSANLSHAAMTSGLEWTVKLPFAKLPDLFRRCQAEFDTYWESPSFQDYHDCDFENLVKATRLERHPTNKGTTNLTLFEITPYEHQLIVLDELEEARAERDQHRNLVVAATGTGKTMIAAFDYKRVCKRHGNRRPKLLFLAHRKEILEQAQDTFRQVLGDGNFGEPLYDGMQPERHDYLFCSVASFNSRKLIDQFGADYWDFVILDEAHHGKASSYRDILNRLQPEILLGLTSTPERTDGSSIAEDFDSPLAAEIRLPDALEKKLLCPFHYYAISDNIDFTSVSWRLGKYNEKELSDLLTGNDVRVNLILKKIIEYLPAPLAPDEFDRDRVKAIGFCVSQKHARFMAESFNKAGVAAISLDSSTENETRKEARSRLRSGEINFIFVVDLFNEGVDIPEVNCLLFLRPTESHVVYIQQLGRGLRHCEGKEQVIVLDFIGKERKEFRYDLRFKSILPGKRHDLNREIADGFPHLPAGCSIHFERTAHRRILDSIRKTFLNIDIRINEAFSDWQGQPPPTFLEFIKKTEEIPVELLTRKSWSDWKQGAGFQTMSDTGERAPELNSLARVSLVTSPNYLRFLAYLLPATPQEIKLLSPHDYDPSHYNNPLY